RNDINRELEKARRFCIDNASSFSEEAQSDIRFALDEMPIAILKEIVNSPAIDSIKKLHLSASHFEETKNRWDIELS
ncbi:hypothetical protein ACXWO4_11450, partial [Streptococcus pyogenes]